MEFLRFYASHVDLIWNSWNIPLSLKKRANTIVFSLTEPDGCDRVP